MSVEKDYKVLIHNGEELFSSYTLHTEWEDGEFIDISSTHTIGEPNGDLIIEDEAADMILEADTAHGKKTINEYTIEWFLIN